MIIKKNNNNLNQIIIKTYITYFGLNGKTATMANNKREADEKMNIPTSQVLISNVHITILKGYEIIE